MSSEALFPEDILPERKAEEKIEGTVNAVKMAAITARPPPMAAAKWKVFVDPPIKAVNIIDVGLQSFVVPDGTGAVNHESIFDPIPQGDIELHNLGYAEVAFANSVMGAIELTKLNDEPAGANMGNFNMGRGILSMPDFREYGNAILAMRETDVDASPHLERYDLGALQRIGTNMTGRQLAYCTKGVLDQLNVGLALRSLHFVNPVLIRQIIQRLYTYNTALIIPPPKLVRDGKGLKEVVTVMPKTFHDVGGAAAPRVRPFITLTRFMEFDEIWEANVAAGSMTVGESPMPAVTSLVGQVSVVSRFIKELGTASPSGAVTFITSLMKYLLSGCCQKVEIIIDGAASPGTGPGLLTIMYFTKPTDHTDGGYAILDELGRLVGIVHAYDKFVGRAVWRPTELRFRDLITRVWGAAELANRWATITSSVEFFVRNPLRVPTRFAAIRQGVMDMGTYKEDAIEMFSDDFCSEITGNTSIYSAFWALINPQNGQRPQADALKALDTQVLRASVTFIFLKAIEVYWTAVCNPAGDEVEPLDASRPAIQLSPHDAFNFIRVGVLEGTEASGASFMARSRIPKMSPVPSALRVAELAPYMFLEIVLDTAKRVLSLGRMRQQKYMYLARRALSFIIEGAEAETDKWLERIFLQEGDTKRQRGGPFNLPYMDNFYVRAAHDDHYAVSEHFYYGVGYPLSLEAGMYQSVLRGALSEIDVVPADFTSLGTRSLMRMTLHKNGVNGMPGLAGRGLRVPARVRWTVEHVKATDGLVGDLSPLQMTTTADGVARLSELRLKYYYGDGVTPINTPCCTMAPASPFITVHRGGDVTSYEVEFDRSGTLFTTGSAFENLKLFVVNHIRLEYSLFEPKQLMAVI